jgi:hypothetical protein
MTVPNDRIRQGGFVHSQERFTMRGAIFAVSLVLLLIGSFRWAAAQSGDHLGIITYVCETDPGGTIGGGFGEMPEDCSYAEGITIRATDQSGAVVAECTTEIGGCSLQVPLGTTITVTEHVSTVPEGYAPTRNPILVDTPPGPVAGEWLREFINVREGSVTLPNTGAGSAERGDGDRGLFTATMVAIILSAVAFGHHRRLAQSRP